MASSIPSSRMSSSISSSSSSSSNTSQNANYSASVIPVALEQITQLSNPQQETKPFSADPKIFFAPFGINTCLFTEKDVDLLLNLFKKTKFNQNICLIDLLGLQFYRLLKQLTASWPDAIQKERQKNWAASYFLGYLGLCRQSVENQVPKTAAAEKFQLAPAKYMQELRIFTKDLASTEEILLKGTKKSQKAYQFLKERTKPLWDEWNALQTLLEKCLIQKEPYKILCDHTLISFSGSEQMTPVAENEALQAIQNLCLYLEMILTTQDSSLEKKWTGLKDIHFRNLLDKTAPLARLKKPKEIVDQSKQLLDFTSKMISDSQEHVKIAKMDLQQAIQGLSHDSWCRGKGIEQKTTKTPDQFLESLIQMQNQLMLKACWLTDCQKILEESIIIPLDPSFLISCAYANRIKLNLDAIFKDLSDIPEDSLLISCFLRNLTIEEKLQNIKLIFFVSLHAQGDLPTITRLCELLDHNYGGIYIKDRNTSILLASLEKLIHHALDGLDALDLDGYEKQSLLEKLLWLSRMFVLLHDFTVLSKPSSECSELEIFPDRFLQLLASDLSPKTSPSQNDPDIETLSEELSFQSLEIASPSYSSDSEPFSSPVIEEMPLEASPIHLESSAIKSVRQAKKPAALSQVDSTVLKKKGKKERKKALIPQSRSPSRVTPPPQTINPAVNPQDVTPRDLLQKRKRRDVEAILTALGLKPIRTKGDHTIWRNPNDERIHTVVPRHDEIKKGTRGAMIKQITPQE